MANLVQKKGQKFKFYGEILEAVSFFGETGIEYSTAKEAIENNPKGSNIIVKNLEHGGATELSLSYLI